MRNCLQVNIVYLCVRDYWSEWHPLVGLSVRVSLQNSAERDRECGCESEK